MSANHDGQGASGEASRRPLLDVEGLAVEFTTGAGRLRAVDGLSISVAPGETLAIVGESGSGKSVSALSIMRLLPGRIARVVSGSIQFDGRDLRSMSDAEIRKVRGSQISMIFQEPMSSLNPILTIGYQITEPLRIHTGVSKEKARERAVELMRMVGIPDAERRLDQYPHQFSGGMRQRVMIAIGLACNPRMIIADEPTTALDVTIQAQILELLKNLSRDLGIALIVITHNLGVVARYADRVAVMYAARLVEEGAAEEIFARPRHPYTMGLLRSVPRLDRPRTGRLQTIDGLPPNLAKAPEGCRFAPRCPFRIDMCSKVPPLEPTDTGARSACFRWQEIADGAIRWEGEPDGGKVALERGKPLLSVKNLRKHFPVSGGMFGKPGVVKAVEDVSFDIARGETLGLVGESGCGKTTVGRLLLGLEDPSAGEISFAGTDLLAAGGDARKDLRRKIQVIFQDPYSSLNPRMTIGQIIGEPLRVYKLAKGPDGERNRVLELLGQVGLRPEMIDRYPHQLSGGQRQRVGIARALAIEPDFIVCDEAVSALDVSIQGQIINLLEDLQRRLGLTFLFIAHDLAVVRHISNRVAVMYLGRIMELADRDELYSNPLHPYTKLLLDAAPVPDPVVEKQRAARLIKGDLPSPVNPPKGCVFHTRCPMAVKECGEVIPQLEAKKDGHFAACIRV
ncbi:MAG: ABC transporter ATP-binding protein [Rhizobiaceae bacterium]|nr:ABC transporter ATP-binding protein [Rhizobiaceae bacterium]